MPVEQSAFTLEAHPAERRSRKSAVTLCVGCCCCCCCLHSAGGLVGAVIGSASAGGGNAAQRHNPFYKETPTARLLYWLMLSATCTAVSVWAFLSRSNGEAGQALLCLYLCLPALQLAASAAAALVILVDRRYEDMRERLGSLGRITAYAVMGALGGSALMFVGCIGLGVGAW